MGVHESSVTKYAACSGIKILFPFSVKRVQGRYGHGNSTIDSSTNTYRAHSPAMR
jgi:hypothetical protein